MVGYSGTPLVNKIGIKPDRRLLFVNAPKNFAATLGELPAGAKAVAKGKAFDVAVIFVSASSDLEAQIRAVRPFLEQNGMIWAAWPKKTSGVATDLVEDRVREIGLAAGLVDVKVCAIDDTWSGLKFVIRIADRAKTAPARNATTIATGAPKRSAKAKAAAK